jgi:hypothetical protein
LRSSTTAKKRGCRGWKKPNTHTHTLSLSLSLFAYQKEIATIKKHRRSKFTQHILSLSLPLNSILCLLNQGFVSIIVANNLRKCNRKKGIWSSAAERGMMPVGETDRQTGKKKG